MRGRPSRWSHHRVIVSRWSRKTLSGVEEKVRVRVRVGVRVREKVRVRVRVRAREKVRVRVLHAYTLVREARERQQMAVTCVDSKPALTLTLTLTRLRPAGSPEAAFSDRPRPMQAARSFGQPRPTSRCGPRRPATNS
eukprot:scaffold119086_cov63-Phaeocystis_antarctica.AAC.1